MLRSLPARLLLAGLLFVPLLSAPGLTCPVFIPVDQVSQNLDDVDEVLNVLLTGSFEDRLTMIEQARWRFAPYDEVSKDQRERVEGQVDSLRLLLATDADSWIIQQLLRGLAPYGLNLLDPLFRDALDHRSASVRSAGIERFLGYTDSAATERLEELWDDEQENWIRHDLALALSCHGSSVHVDEMLKKLVSDDEVAVGLALRALARGSDDKALPIVLRLAKRDSEPFRIPALAALRAWPDSVAARRVLLNAGQSEDEEVVNAVVESLLVFEGPEALEGLQRLAAGSDRMLVQIVFTGSPAIRQAIVEGVGAEQRATWTELFGVDISELLPSLPVDPLFDPDDQLDSDFAGEACGESPFRTSVPQQQRRIQPEDGSLSVRCFSSPAREGDPEFDLRIPTGAQAPEWDRFVDGDSAWKQVLADHRFCWVPASQLVEPKDVVESTLPYEGPRVRAEFDLAVDELASPQAKVLHAAGVLRLFDPGERIVGVILDVDSGNPESLEALGAFRWSGALLDSHITIALHDLLKIHPTHARLVEAVEALPPATPQVEARLDSIRSAMLRPD